MPTPKDVRYTTPVNVSPRSINAFHSTGSSSNRRVPTPIVNALQLQIRRMISGGLNFPDLKIMHREGHSLKEAGKWDEAEEKFCEALVGCQVLLSPAHKHTSNLTYHLADFYAQFNRMKDAYGILDWMTDTMLSQISPREETFFDHLLKIAELLRQWKRLEEAKAFGKVLVQLVDTTHIEREGSATEISTTIPRVNMSRSLLIETTSAQPLQSFIMPLKTKTKDVTDASQMDDRKLVESQLSLALTYVEANDKAVEQFLQTIIDQCKLHPANMIAQILKALTTLVEFYQKVRRFGDVTRVLQEIREQLLKITRRDYQRMESLPQSAIETAKYLFQVGEDDMAAGVLSAIEGGIADAFADDVDRLRDLLIGIGIWFQEKKRWTDARPRFEQALNLALAEHGFHCDLVKRLESTIEHHRYIHGAERPCECFESSDQTRGSCTVCTITSPTGQIVEASKIHMILMDCNEVVYGLV